MMQPFFDRYCRLRFRSSCGQWLARRRRCGVAALILLACLGLGMRGVALMRQGQTARPPYAVGQIERIMGKGVKSRCLGGQPTTPAPHQPLFPGDVIIVPRKCTLQIRFYPVEPQGPQRATVETKVVTTLLVKQGHLEAEPTDTKIIYTPLPRVPKRMRLPQGGNPLDPNITIIHSRGIAGLSMEPLHAVSPAADGQISLRWKTRSESAAKMRPVLTVYHDDAVMLSEKTLSEGTSLFPLPVSPGGEYRWILDIGKADNKPFPIRGEGRFRVLTQIEQKAMNQELIEAQKKRKGDDAVAIALREIEVYEAYDLLGDARQRLNALLETLKDDHPEREALIEMRRRFDDALRPAEPKELPSETKDANETKEKL